MASEPSRSREVGNRTSCTSIWAIVVGGRRTLAPCPIGAQPLPRGAEPVDTELHDVPVGEVARWALAEAHTGGRARGNDVAGEERHELADVADERRHVEDQLAGRPA